jgi:hypothetical protein
MPFSFHVDENTRVIHVQVIGEVTDAELVDLSDRLRRESAFVAGYPILCDASTLTAALISSSLNASLGRAARSRRNLVAIIAPSPVGFGLARMYQIFSDSEDTRIQVFTRAAEAMAWLEMRGERRVRLPKP